MSVSISVAAIIAAAESRLRIPVCTATSAYTAAEMLVAVQEAVKSLYALAREKMGEDFDCLLDTPLATVASSSSVDLSAVANFGELYRLVWVDGDSLTEINELPVHRFEPPGFRPRAWAKSGRDEPAYRLTGANTLRVFPCPLSVYTLHCWYTAHTPVDTATDTFQGRLEWNKWVELDVCWRVSVSKKRDGSVFVAERNQLAMSIFSPNRERAPEARRVIRDVEGMGGGGCGTYNRRTGEYE